MKKCTLGGQWKTMREGSEEPRDEMGPLLYSVCPLNRIFAIVNIMNPLPGSKYDADRECLGMRQPTMIIACVG